MFERHLSDGFNHCSLSRGHLILTPSLWSSRRFEQRLCPSTNVLFHFMALCLWPAIPTVLSSILQSFKVSFIYIKCSKPKLAKIRQTCLSVLLPKSRYRTFPLPQKPLSCLLSSQAHPTITRTTTYYGFSHCRSEFWFWGNFNKLNGCVLFCVWFLSKSSHFVEKTFLSLNYRAFVEDRLTVHAWGCLWILYSIF